MAYEDPREIERTKDDDDRKAEERAKDQDNKAKEESEQPYKYSDWASI